ncbi:unnamed protein product [Cylicocyclus nassatus]|uniref:Uncharacterized protein n=1 Tax=Cylicocyclus nassatus TaxID=53992 RepID=A0AA36M8X1_CYLNA|nr:unnamed protein product [Cylicocyclus nassatus]
MRLITCLAVEAVLFALVDTAIVGVRFEVVCRIQRHRRLRRGHRLWVHALLMERDSWSEDDLLRERQYRNRDDSPRMGLTLYSGDASDGFGDYYLEVYLDIVHNCVRYHKMETRTKRIEVGDFPVDKREPTLVNLGRIYLP